MKFHYNIALLAAINIAMTTQGSIIDERLDDFIQRIVPNNDQLSFRLFYNELIYHQQKDKQNPDVIIRNKQKEHVQQLQERAKISLASLEVRDPLIANEIKPYLEKKLSMSTEQKVTKFLFRYGAYEEYLQKKIEKQNSILGKTRSYFTNLRNRLASWFSFKRFRKTA